MKKGRFFLRKKNNEQFLEASLPLKNKRGEKNEKRKRE